MNEADKRIINEFKSRIAGEMFKKIRRVLAFGSRARGDNAPDSDLDILVLVDSYERALEDAVDDAAYQAMWDADFRPVLSVKVMAEDRFQDYLKKDFSFYRNVNFEGIVV